MLPGTWLRTRYWEGEWELEKGRLFPLRVHSCVQVGLILGLAKGTRNQETRPKYRHRVPKASAEFRNRQFIPQSQGGGVVTSMLL